MVPTPSDVEGLLRNAYDRVHPRDGGWLLPGSLAAGAVWVQAFERVPEGPGAVQEALERGRQDHGAERAVGVLLEGAPHAGTVHPRAVGLRVLEFRAFLLEVTGLAARAEKTVLEHEARWQSAPHLPWSGLYDPEEDEVSAVEFILEWLRDPSRPTLILDAPAFARNQVVTAVRYLAARALSREEAPPALLEDYGALIEPPEVALRCNALVPYVELEPDTPHLTLERLADTRYLVGADGEPFVDWPEEFESLELRPFDIGEVLDWMVARHGAEARTRLKRALDGSPNLLQLADDPASYPCLLQATLGAFRDQDGAATLDPVPLAVRDYVTRTLEREVGDPLSPLDMEEIALLEDAAFYDYLGARAEPLAHLGFAEFEAHPRLLGWLEEDGDFDGVRFANVLVRNALVAMKVARDVRLGRQETLDRYRFPERDLRQHLRALLPAAALAALEGG